MPRTHRTGPEIPETWHCQPSQRPRPLRRAQSSHPLSPSRCPHSFPASITLPYPCVRGMVLPPLPPAALCPFLTLAPPSQVLPFPRALLPPFARASEPRPYLTLSPSSFCAYVAVLPAVTCFPALFPRSSPPHHLPVCSSRHLPNSLSLSPFS